MIVTADHKIIKQEVPRVGIISVSWRLIFLFGAGIGAEGMVSYLRESTPAVSARPACNFHGVSSILKRSLWYLVDP